MAFGLTYGATGFTFNEVSGNNGAIANGLTINVAGATFAGNNGDSLLLDTNTVTGIPTGLTAVLVKTSGTTARLTFKGTATTHNSDVNTLVITFKNAQFVANSGETVPADGNFALTNDALNFNFDVAVTGAGALTLVAPVATTGKALPIALTGTSTDANSKVAIFNGTKLLDQTTSSGGNWSYTMPTGVRDGVYTLTAREVFTEGTTTVYGSPTDTITYTVDAKVPSAPTITNSFKLATADTTPVISGKAEKGATVNVYKGSVSEANKLGTAVADAQTGAWTLQIAADKALAEGSNTITATATDAAGNVSAAATKSVTVMVDTTVEALTLQFTTDPDTDTINITKVATQKLDGTGEKGAMIQVYGGADGSVALGKAIKVDQYGKWKTSIKLTDGEHKLSAVATDVAGNISANTTVTDNTTVKIDTVAPRTPTLTEPSPTPDAYLPATLSGKAEAGSKVAFYVGTTKLVEFTEGTSDDADTDAGEWTFSTSTFTGTLPAGAKQLTAKATDAAGNVSKASTAVTYIFLPGGPTINGTEGDDTAITGTAAAEPINGLAGDDVIDGKVGNDTITGGAGADNMTGGDGTDTVSYADVTTATSHALTGVAGVAINLSAALITAGDIATAMDGGIVLGGGAGAAGAALAAGTAGYLATGAGASTETMVRDTLATIENVLGSALGDYIAGGATANGIDGGAGNDVLLGNEGNDSLTGGAGNDTLTGGVGNDTMTGDAGADTFTITTTAADTDTITDWGDGVDALAGTAFAGQTLKVTINDVSATAFNAATAFASNGVVSVTGGAASDAITGGAGNDTINGGAGDDAMTGGSGADTFTITTTAADTDTITDWGVGADVLAGEAFAGQTLKVTIHGSSATPFSAAAAFATKGAVSVTGGVGNDTITGGGGADTITGGAGDDTIVGGAGTDKITGGVGTDKITLGAGIDTVIYGASAGELVTYAGTDTDAAKIEKILDFNTSDDTLQFTSGSTFAGIALAGTTGFTVNEGLSVPIALATGLATITLLTAAMETAASGVASTADAAGEATGIQAYVFQTAAGAGAFDGKTFLVINDGTATLTAADVIIELTGVTGTLSAADLTILTIV